MISMIKFFLANEQYQGLTPLSMIKHYKIKLTMIITKYHQTPNHNEKHAG